MEVPGKIMRGRPKRRWLDNIKNDLSERELSGEEAQDRVQWRHLIRNIDPTEVLKDAEEEEKKKISVYLKTLLITRHVTRATHHI